MFDLVLLGLGTDGHTASLFPDSPPLDDPTQWVAMTTAPNAPTRRMTLTYPVLNAARQVWCVVTGHAKREIVVRCLDAVATRRLLPVQRIRPTAGKMVWWLDNAATGSTVKRDEKK